MYSTKTGLLKRSFKRQSRCQNVCCECGWM